MLRGSEREVKILPALDIEAASFRVVEIREMDEAINRNPETIEISVFHA